MNIRLLLSLALCVVITGCGWHMRGSEGSTANIKALTVVSGSPYGKTERAMEKQLKSNHIESNTPDSWHLQILKETMDGNTLAFSDDNNAATQEIILEVRFSVTDGKGAVVIEPTTERVTRILESDSNRRLSSDREIDLMKQEIHDEMAANLLRRINNITQKP